MVDFRRKLEELRARKATGAPVETRTIEKVKLTSIDAMDDGSFAIRGISPAPELTSEAKGPSKLFRIIVRVADTKDTPPILTQEVTEYDVTNTTQNNYVLREAGKEGKGRTNLAKERVGGCDTDLRPIIRKSTAVGEDGGIHSSAEAWVFGNVDMYIGMVKNDMITTLVSLCGRATACQIALTDD